MAAQTYFSLNQGETLLLQRASFEAIGLYLLLKEKANFKTGEVGTFRKQKLTYAWFARAMDRPASQGRAAQTFDTKAVQRLLAQLAEVGLVADERWEDSRLTLRLPFSPLWEKNPELQSGKVKLPQDIPEFSAEIAAAQPSPALPAFPSVMTSERGSIPFFNTAITTDSGARSGADSLEVQPANDDALAAQFEAAIAEAGGIYAHTADSRAFYKSWARQGFDLSRIKDEAALWELFQSEPLTPGALNKHLRPSQQQEAQKRRRGGVCL